MTTTQQAFSAVENLGDTLVSPYLTTKDIKDNDTLVFAKDGDRPLIWSEVIKFTDDDGNTKETTVYKCAVKKDDEIYHLRLNGKMRNAIYAKVKNDVKSIEGKKITFITSGQGKYKHLLISNIE